LLWKLKNFVQKVLIFDILAGKYEGVQKLFERPVITIYWSLNHCRTNIGHFGNKKTQLAVI